MLSTIIGTVVLFMSLAAPLQPEGAPQVDPAHPQTEYLRVELETPGGPLPFVISARHHGVVHQRNQMMYYDVLICNAQERIDAAMVSVMARDGRSTHTRIGFDQYDSKIEGVVDWGGPRPSASIRDLLSAGSWTKFRKGEQTELKLNARPAEAVTDRFDPMEGDADPSPFAGRWRVEFDSSDEPAVGVFEVDENQIATGTFLTTTGDYRFLEGRVDGPHLRLSAFDGAHAFLFHAETQEDGSIKGDFWSGNWWHETWTAVRDEDATLPDAFEQTTITDEQAFADAVFRDTDGTPTRVFDALDATNAPARVLELFGTWCPNCTDAGRELVSLKQQYGDDLGIVGLAFEVTEDFERSAQQVQRHHAHIGSDWPILIAGLSDKAKATETLGFLNRVRAYPTLIFLNADNEVQAIHTGFSGPATGEAYERQRDRFEQLIEGMIGG